MRDCKGKFTKGHEVPEEWRKKLQLLARQRLETRDDLWKPEEIDYLRRFYGKVPVSVIAEKLGRGYHATKKKAQQLGLRSHLCGTNVGKERSYKDPIRDKPLEMNKSLAYVLGVVKGDGCCRKLKNCDSYRIILKTVDEDFAHNFIEHLKALGYQPHLYRYPSKPVPFHVELCSKELYLFISRFNITELLKCNDEIKAYFLKGFFDSDGSAPKTVKRVIIYNTNYELMVLVKQLLGQLNIETNPIHVTVRGVQGRNRKPLYSFTIKAESLQRFCEVVGFSIARKMENLINKLREGGWP